MFRPTVPLYWEDDHCFSHEASIVAVREDAVACDRTCFYPGGGGQPADCGCLTLADGSAHAVAGVERDEQRVIWHRLERPAGVVGERVRLALDEAWRLAHMRYHTVLHVLNTVALRDFDAWITGVQIGADYSRIDFRFEGLSPEVCRRMEERVNGVLGERRPLRAGSVSEAEFAARPELRRTLEVSPPVVDGRVRIVEIEGFDAQACGGTHMHNTAEVGRFRITRTENKGRINKRLYIRLE